MTFLFTEDCMIGIEEIDTEHQYLFTILNQIVDTLNNNEGVHDETQKLETYLERLKEYAQIHFGHEEAYMEKTKDLELPRQKREHKYFVNKIESIDLMDLSDEERRNILEDMLRYLTKWLYRHILSSDTLIGQTGHISEKKESKNVFEFTTKYMTGITAIDEEHQKLFELMADVYRMVDSNAYRDSYDEVMYMIDQLEDEIKIHVSHEEEYMESTQYPHTDAHKKAHDIVLARLEDKDSGEHEEDHHAFLLDLLDFLFSWMGNHIIKMDKGII